MYTYIHLPVGSALLCSLSPLLCTFEKMFPASNAVPIDPNLWRACAGSKVNIPQVGAKVYYFPEGHAEQCAQHSASLPPALLRNNSIVPCRVLHVRYFIDRVTDELSAVISLQQAQAAPFDSSCRQLLDDADRREGGGYPCSSIESFMKILTQSDANNGGGFSVPRQCAEAIFPPLNYQDDPPVQNLTISDVQGGEWVFRHIYRGKPKRHLLTTGWSKFVNHKKLIGGDTIIFMRNAITRKMHIGIRRLRDKKGGHNGTRSVLSPCIVEEAAMRAARGLPFEVVVYPRSGMSDFVVNADLVDRALSFRWAVGMRVKMDIAAEDPSRRACLQGHVSLVRYSQERGSLWKMLQVTWIEPEHLQNVEMLNPWQLECADYPAIVPRIYPPSELLVPRSFHPLAAGIRDPKSMMGQRGHLFGVRNHPLFNSNAQLACMQVARHLSDISSNTCRMRSSEDILHRTNMSLLRSKITEVHPTEGCRDLRSFGAGIPRSIMACSGKSSIQLFGKNICVNNPEGSQPIDACCEERYSCTVGGKEDEDKGVTEHTSAARATTVEGS